MKKLRVALLNDSFPPVVDGVANTMVNYAREIKKLYGEATVITPDYPNARDEYPFEVIRYQSLYVGKRMGYRAGNPLDARMLKQLSGREFDLIHVHCPAISALVGRILRYGRNKYVPLVLTYHTKFDVDLGRIFPFTPLRRLSKHLLLQNIRACDEVWVVSQGAGDNLRELGYTGSMRVMENGTDFERGRAGEEEVKRLKEELRIYDDAPIFLFVGRLGWFKGIRLYMDAFRQYLERGNKGHLLLVGDGQDRKEMESYARKIGIASFCLFPGMVRDRALLRTYYTLGDLFLFVNTYDTSGIVVKEAAACSLPSVTLRASCPSEGMTDGRNGIIIDSDAQQLSKVMEKVCFDRDWIRAIGQKAGEELYISWETAVKRAAQRYEQIVEMYADKSPERVLKDWNTIAEELNRLIRKLENEFYDEHDDDHE